MYCMALKVYTCQEAASGPKTFLNIQYFANFCNKMNLPNLTVVLIPISTHPNAHTFCQDDKIDKELQYRYLALSAHLAVKLVKIYDAHLFVSGAINSTVTWACQHTRPSRLSALRLVRLAADALLRQLHSPQGTNLFIGICRYWRNLVPGTLRLCTI
jgi:hypothetical protein